MSTNELSHSAVLARRALRIILLPAIALAIIVRFAAPSWFDFVFWGMLLLFLALVIVGRVATSSRGDASGPEQK
jgi:hypothetical protein